LVENGNSFQKWYWLKFYSILLFIRNAFGFRISKINYYEKSKQFYLPASFGEDNLNQFVIAHEKCFQKSKRKVGRHLLQVLLKASFFIIFGAFSLASCSTDRDKLSPELSQNINLGTSASFKLDAQSWAQCLASADFGLRNISSF